MNKHWLVTRGNKRLVLRKWGAQEKGSIDYERSLLELLVGMGWPVAPQWEMAEIDGCFWSLSPLLTGEPKPVGTIGELRERGRLLAEFHLATARLQGLRQRPDWRRCEEILLDPELDEVLSAAEPARGEEVRIVRWHLDRARLRIEGLGLSDRKSIPNHGDFARWNLLYEDGRLSGVLDFEMAHNDHRVGDFSLAWRGKYDEVIEGYEEVSPLEPEEWALLVPCWWAHLIEQSCRDFREGAFDDGWAISKLMVRSPAMGSDAGERP